MILIPILAGLYLIGALGYYKMMWRVIENRTSTEMNEAVDELSTLAPPETTSKLVGAVLAFFSLIWPVSLYVTLTKEAMK